jgi:hypothetical protein
VVSRCHPGWLQSDTVSTRKQSLPKRSFPKGDDGGYVGPRELEFVPSATSSRSTADATSRSSIHARSANFEEPARNLQPMRCTSRPRSDALPSPSFRCWLESIWRWTRLVGRLLQGSTTVPSGLECTRSRGARRGSEAHGSAVAQGGVLRPGAPGDGDRPPGRGVVLAR